MSVSKSAPELEADAPQLSLARCESEQSIFDDMGGVDPNHTDRKKCLILYTGGTMGMKPSASGSLEPCAGYLTEEIKKAPELIDNESMPIFDIKEYQPLIDSSAMGPRDWIQIATDIEKSYYDYDGFVVIMGTDTMAYAASAMSFMLENLGKTVVFTGSQIPFAEVYNDARRNLIVSLIFCVQDDFPEVCVCFNDKLMRANRTVKINSVDLNAFDSPNFPALATLGVYIFERKELARPQPKSPFRVHKKLTASIMVIKLVPGFDDECISTLVEHSTKLRAIVLELYGAGNGPAGQKSTFLNALRVAQKKGIVVVACSQCLSGGVSLDSYSLGKEFKESGVLGAGDMTTEACTTKLAYLFGRGATIDSMPGLLTKNIRGEISSVEAITPKNYLGKRASSDFEIHGGGTSSRYVKQARVGDIGGL